jgi:hypothetical protein
LKLPPLFWVFIRHVMVLLLLPGLSPGLRPLLDQDRLGVE